MKLQINTNSAQGSSNNDFNHTAEGKPNKRKTNRTTTLAHLDHQSAAVPGEGTGYKNITHISIQCV